MKRKNIFGVCAFAAFILVLTDAGISGISVRTWLAYLVTASGWLLWTEKRKKVKPQDRKKRKWGELDYLLGICLIWNVLQIITGCIKRTGCEESSLLGIVLIMLFFLASMEDFSLIYTDAGLICALAVYAGLLWHFMADSSYEFGIRLLIKDEQALASFLLLINMISTGRYCRTADKAKQKFYFITALAGYFLSFINRNAVGIALMGICFMLFLLMYEPHREFVKRAMQMAFVYFFLLSNMSLIVNYTALIKTECPYSLENSVYLELAMALAGVCFFTYLDKLGEDGGRPLYGFRNAVRWILAGSGITLLLLLAMGNRLDGMDPSKGRIVLQQLSAELRGYATAHNGTFYDVIGSHGAAGGVWLICTALAAVRKLQIQVGEKRADPMLTVISAMYMLQSVFFSVQPVTAPVYAVLTAAALYGDGGNAVDRGYSGKSTGKAGIRQQDVKEAT